MINEIDADALKFAGRFNEACNKSLACPPLHKGRLKWISDKFFESTGDRLSIESVRKWSSGQSLPRPRRGEVLAEILQIDAAWLYFGENGANPEKTVVNPTNTDIILQHNPSFTLELRSGLKVEISGLPSDLTMNEANRLSRVILALATIEG